MRRKPYNAIQLNPKDNVVCLLQDMRAGSSPAVAGTSVPALQQDTELGHKIAISRIEQGTFILKYGEAIGRATRTIEPGEHVHLQGYGIVDEA